MKKISLNRFERIDKATTRIINFNPPINMIISTFNIYIIESLSLFIQNK